MGNRLVGPWGAISPPRQVSQDRLQCPIPSASSAGVHWPLHCTTSAISAHVPDRKPTALATLGINPVVLGPEASGGSAWFGSPRGSPLCCLVPCPAVLRGRSLRRARKGHGAACQPEAQGDFGLFVLKKKLFEKQRGRERHLSSAGLFPQMAAKGQSQELRIPPRFPT